MDVDELEGRIASVIGVAEVLLDKDGTAGRRLLKIALEASDLFDEGRYEDAERKIEEAISEFNLDI